MDIFTNVKEIAKNKSITIAQIERDTGIAANTMRKWAAHSPSIDKVWILSNYLDCSVDEILGIKKEPADGELDEQIIQMVRILSSLPEDKLQRVRDFLAGISGS